MSMTSNHILITSLLSLLLSPSLITSSPQQICNFTTYPDFCNSSLPHYINHSLTNFDYGKISIQQSLSHAQRFLLLIQHYLGDDQTLNSPPRSSRSLEDCQYLTTLNINFFSGSLETLNLNDKLNMYQVDDLHTLLSATLTNLQTCFDGLVEATNHKSSSTPRQLNELTMSPYFSLGTKSYSVSLAIFKHTWVDGKKNSSHLDVMNINVLLSQIGNWFETDEQDGSMISGSVVVVVSKDGGGDFDTISDALKNVSKNKITSNSDSYCVMFIKQGTYAENVLVPSHMTNLILIGAGINKTVITGNRSVAGNWTTFDSATFAVDGEGFVAINITFCNTAGAMNGQAVAVRNGADRSAFYLCSFEGYQDTLYAESMRQFYRECDVYGTIDFIFDNAAIVFQNCTIYARKPLNGQGNMITAQGRADPNQNTGTCFHDCRIKAADDLISSNYNVETYLGRPWKEYSKTVYMLSFMDSLVNPSGWSKWGGEDDDFALNTLYYAEYKNYGPGSKRSNRVMIWPGYHVINSTDAANFTVTNFISGDAWLPPLVPCVAGL